MTRHTAFHLGWRGGLVGVLTLALTWLVAAPAPAQASGDVVKVACSAQVYEALQNGALAGFSEKTGVKVAVDVFASNTAVTKLAKGGYDLAFTAEKLPADLADKGLNYRPLAKDALVIISHPQVKVKGLSLAQARGVFSGAIANWSEVGGAKLPVRVILPAPDTAAHQEFSRLVMNGAPMDYYLMARRSTTSASAVHRVNGGVSFINQATTQGRPEATRILKIDGKGPKDAGYPYFEVFAVVWKSPAPAAPAARLVDYLASEEGMQHLTQRGLLPLDK